MDKGEEKESLDNTDDISYNNIVTKMKIGGYGYDGEINDKRMIDHIRDEIYREWLFGSWRIL